jgi:hypothetical protein
MSAIAILHADRVRHGRLWDMEFDGGIFDGGIIVVGSRDPEFDLALASSCLRQEHLANIYTDCTPCLSSNRDLI